MSKDDHTEVFVEFNPQFSASYTGVPLTVQFCLGRMTYKRQHFAVDCAKGILGDGFLFPEENYEVKPNRIPFYEVDEDEVGDKEEAELSSEVRIFINSYVFKNDLKIYY